MVLSLATGLIGIKTDLAGAIDLAARHGFAGVDSTSSQLFALSSQEVENALQSLSKVNLRAGYFSVDVAISAANDADWKSGLEKLINAASNARNLGYTRSTIVVLPFSETRNYDENFRFHLARLKEIAPILADNGISLGLEYVSPLTRRAPYAHQFVHNLRGVLELLDAADAPNLGLLLDSFHWFCAGEEASQIAQLAASQIVAVHFNDAIASRPRDEQVAFERELPGDSGEINLSAFVGALKTARYDGPLTCEPMNKTLNEMDADEATARTFAAMRRTLNLS